MNFLFIAGINRSGGSLLARLFDGHKDFLSYPMEVRFRFDKTSYGFIDKITGTPTYIPEFNKEYDPIKYFEAEKEIVNYEWGKEISSKHGIRKNYLEKAYYENFLNTDFNYDYYIKKLIEYCSNCNSNQEFFEGKHKAFFESWDNGKYFFKSKYVVTHDSNGLFLSNFDNYFADFKNSFVFIPIRDCLGYVAAEKTRIARRFFGSKRFSKPLPPNILIKKFNYYDLESIIRSWQISISRIKLLQEKHRSNKRLITYKFEKLTEDPEMTMNFFANILSIEFEKTLTKPTLCGKDWLGNSQQGKSFGIKRNPNDYFEEVLTKEEIFRINEKTYQLTSEIKQLKSVDINLTDLGDNLFFDISNQRKSSKNKYSWSLYCSLGFSGFRKLKLNKPNYLSIIAIFFSTFVKFCHIPRLVKQKFFPGKGKQNYT